MVCHLTVRNWLNNVALNRWIGHQGLDDRACLAWPPHSPDLTQCDFYLWGFIKCVCASTSSCLTRYKKQDLISVSINYFRHTDQGMGRTHLSTGCVPCDQWCSLRHQIPAQFCKLPYLPQAFLLIVYNA
ncbi:hypothetical protein J437_LFUL019083 [Ladona fulva]|uniref:Uncharacterized protein n=1 Tax=Ladona fulva TaxID=123851 RepID=A0A8K0KQT9_LADFU|nr:hypothetical protein J437_LFUL019083 [Ladona fulva]